MYVIGETYMDTEDIKGIHIQGAASFDEAEIVIRKGMVSIDDVVYQFATSGDWMGKFNGNELCLQLANGGKVRDYSFSISFCDRDFGASVYPSAKGPFNLARAAGVLTLDGNFNGKKGKGDYTFAEDANFRNYLNGEGYTYITENLMLHLYIAEIGKDFFTLQAYFKSFRKTGLGKPEISDIVAMSIHDIDPSYIEEMGGELFKDLTINDIVQANIHDIDPEYIRSINELGYDDLDFEEIVQFSIHDINPDFIKSIRESGLNLTKEEIYENLAFSDLIQFGIHDINPDFIKSIRESGLNLTKEEIIQAGIHDIDIHGVDADFIEDFKQLGFKNIPVNKLITLKIHGVTPRYIQRVNQNGDYDNYSLKDFINLKIHGPSKKTRRQE